MFKHPNQDFSDYLIFTLIINYKLFYTITRHQSQDCLSESILILNQPSLLCFITKTGSYSFFFGWQYLYANHERLGEMYKSIDVLPSTLRCNTFHMLHKQYPGYFRQLSYILRGACHLSSQYQKARLECLVAFHWGQQGWPNPTPSASANHTHQDDLRPQNLLSGSSPAAIPWTQPSVIVSREPDYTRFPGTSEQRNRDLSF